MSWVRYAEGLKSKVWARLSGHKCGSLEVIVLGSGKVQREVSPLSCPQTAA